MAAALPAVTQLPVSSVFFTQRKIGACFRIGRHTGEHGGHPIESLVSQLHSGAVSLNEDFLVLDVVDYHGRVLSLRNRRLWCLKKYAAEIGQVHLLITVRLWPLQHGVLVQPENRDIVHKFYEQFEGGDGTDVTIRATSVSRSPSAAREAHAAGGVKEGQRPNTKPPLRRNKASEPIFIPAKIDGYSCRQEALVSWLHTHRQHAFVCTEGEQAAAMNAGVSFDELRVRDEAKELEKERKRTTTDNNADNENVLTVSVLSMRVTSDAEERRGALVLRAPAFAADLAAVFGLKAEGLSVGGEVRVFINGIIFGVFGGRVESKSGTAGFLNRVTGRAGNGYLMLCGLTWSVCMAVDLVMQSSFANGSDAATMSIPYPDGQLLLAALGSPLEVVFDYSAEKSLKRIVLLARSLSDLLQFSQAVLRKSAEPLKPGQITASVLFTVGHEGSRGNWGCRGNWGWQDNWGSQGSWGSQCSRGIHTSTRRSGLDSGLGI